MNRAEKEAYLRDYELLKKKGKPFFPYAVMKDSTMALIVVLVIILMALVLGAEQGPKADPTTTTYVPRPEWYFFFLFEVLRVIKPPELVPLATIGIPTIAHGPAAAAAVLRPQPGAPPGAPADRDDRLAADDRRDGLPHLPRAPPAGSPTEIDMKVAPQYEAGKEVVAQSGCLACHKIGENGNNGPGPGTDPHRRPHPARGDPALGRNRAGHHALLPDLPPKKLNELADFLSSLD